MTALAHAYGFVYVDAYEIDVDRLTPEQIDGLIHRYAPEFERGDLEDLRRRLLLACALIPATNTTTHRLRRYPPADYTPPS